MAIGHLAATNNRHEHTIQPNYLNTYFWGVYILFLILCHTLCVCVCVMCDV